MRFGFFLVKLRPFTTVYLGFCALQWQMYCVMVSSSKRSSNFLLKSGRNLFTKPGPELEGQCDVSEQKLHAAELLPPLTPLWLTPRPRSSDDSQWIKVGNHHCNSFNPAWRRWPLHHLRPLTLALLVLCLRSLRKTPWVNQDQMRHSGRKRKPQRGFLHKLSLVFIPTVIEPA